MESLTLPSQLLALAAALGWASGFMVFVEFFVDYRKRGGAMAPSPAGGWPGWWPAAAPLVTAAGPHPSLPPEGEGAKAFCAGFQKRAKE